VSEHASVSSRALQTRAFALIVGFAIGLPACGPSAESLECARILAAIDALRNSPATEPTGRLALAEKLASENAVVPEAVHARDACAKAYRLFAQSSLAETEAEKSFVSKDKESALDTLTSLDAAQKKLVEANALMTKCSEASTVLRLKK
jgi:hypothetical protein